MPNVRIQVSHALSRQVAMDRLRQYSQKLQTDFADKVTNFEEKWTAEGIANFAFRVMGFSVSGTTAVNDDQVQVDVQLPFAAIPFRGIIEKEIASRLEAALTDGSVESTETG